MDLDPDKFTELVKLGAEAMSPAIRSKHNDWPGWPGTYRLAHLALSEVLPRVIPDSGVAPALWDVHSERQRQDQKWGGAEHDDQHTVAEFVQLIQDYAGWARVMDSMNSSQKARTRLIQVAALAVAAAESLDRREDARHAPQRAPVAWQRATHAADTRIAHVWASALQHRSRAPMACGRVAMADGEVKGDVRNLRQMLAECEPYLKEGETPAQRIQRERRDTEAVLNLLIREKRKSERMVEALRLIASTTTDHGAREEAEQALGTDGVTVTPSVPRLPACKQCDGKGERLENGTVFVCGGCLGNGVQMDKNSPYTGESGWKLHRCADGEQCRAAIPGGCASGWCAHFGLSHEKLHPNIDCVREASDAG